MASLIIVVGNLLDEAHELRKIVEMCEKAIDLVNRCIYHYRCMMFYHVIFICHTISFLSVSYISVWRRGEQPDRLTDLPQPSNAQQALLSLTVRSKDTFIIT